VREVLVEDETKSDRDRPDDQLALATARKA
jgi:hypothetical protein